MEEMLVVHSLVFSVTRREEKSYLLFQSRYSGTYQNNDLDLQGCRRQTFVFEQIFIVHNEVYY